MPFPSGLGSGSGFTQLGLGSGSGFTQLSVVPVMEKQQEKEVRGVQYRLVPALFRSQVDQTCVQRRLVPDMRNMALLMHSKTLMMGLWMYRDVLQLYFVSIIEPFLDRFLV